MLLGGERGHSWSAAAGEQGPDHGGPFGPDPAGEIGRFEARGERYLQARQMSATSVSLTRACVARLFSTTALTSSGNDNSACRTSPLSRCISSASVAGVG